MRFFRPRNWTYVLLLIVGLHHGALCAASVEEVRWDNRGRQSQVLVARDRAWPTANRSCTVSLWVRLEGNADSFPALAANKPWEGGEIVDLISTSNMGITRSTGVGPGWALALQPNGSWQWNLGNGQQRLDYLPTAERQPINDGHWHLLAFTIDRKSNSARLFYDGKNVAIYAINGFDNLNAEQEAFVGGDRAGQLPAIDGLAGVIQGAQFHSAALADEQVFAMYQRRFPNATYHRPSIEADELKVLAWNIWHGARHPGIEQGIQQAVDFIQHTQADVITMQETYGSGPIIADRLGYYFYLRSSNLSVMSRFPIEETHDLYEPFRFGGVTVRLGESRRVNVFSLWIHYLPAWRRDSAAEGATAEALVEGEWQTRATELQDILKQLKPFIDASDKIPLIVGGDFNSPSTLDWNQSTAAWHDSLIVDWPVSRQMLDLGFTDTYRAIHRDPTKHDAHDLYDRDAQRITYRIDYIYTHGQGVTTTASRMMNTHNGTWPSDHPAVLSTLKLKPNQLGIVSYNILEGFANGANGRFPDGAVRRKAVSKWLAEQAPAIVGFQELNGYTQDRLAEESRAWGHGHAATVKEGGYIVGLTSREPIEVVERHLDGMHHGLLHAQTMGIDCFVVHLSPFKARHRQREAHMIVQRVQTAMNEGHPVIVMGDFNALSPQDRAAYDGNTELLDRMRNSDATHGHIENLIDGKIDYSVMQVFLDAGLVDLFAKHRDADPLTGEQRIDFILASPNLAEHLVDAAWHTEQEFDGMSDHPPTTATLMPH